MYRAIRACLDAFTAADAFCTVAVLNRINIHFTYVGALAASDAFILVKRHMNKTYFIEKRINCTERTHNFAEKSVHKEACNYNGCKYYHL